MPKRKLVIIKGATQNRLAAIDLYWWFFLWQRRREYGKDYEISVLNKPSLQDTVKALEESDAAIFYGHGHKGVVHLGSEDFTTAELRKLMRPLDFVHLACCDTVSDEAWVSEWLRITPTLTGFPGVTYDWRRPWRIPKAKEFKR